MTDSFPLRLPPSLVGAGALLLSGTLLNADSVVVFNEINYNPLGPSENGEWIELYNQMGINVDLSSWRISGGINFDFPEGTLVPPGGFVIVAKDPGNNALDGLPLVVGPYEGFLSNGGDRIDLRTGSDRLMDRLDYDDQGAWPVAPDGGGVTLAKREPLLFSGKTDHWLPSLQEGGTPGALNFAQPGDPVNYSLIVGNASWKYNDSGNAPASNWNEPSFADGGWSRDLPPFSSSGGGEAILTITQHLVERFRASDIAGATDGQPLTSWPDTATDDGVSQNATAGGNPVYRDNATVSGQPAVRFDGNDEFRTSLPPGIGSTSGFVYFAVVRATSPPGAGGVNDGSGPYIFDRDISTTGNPLASLKNHVGRFGFQKRFDSGAGLGGPVSTTSISTSTFQIVAVRRNPGDNRFEIWVDGVMEATQGDSGSALTPQPIVIGRHATNVNGGFAGDIAELLVYEDELTSAEFNEVGSYLEARYGLNTAFPDADGVGGTAISSSAGTSYFRRPFTFNGTPSHTALRLDATVGDGAVFYLNGVEVHRANMPAGTVTHGSDALSESILTVDSLSLSGTLLQPGTNVLAVSLHTGPGGNTTSFAATLNGTESPPDPSTPSSLAFNEISGAGDDTFFIEIMNTSAAPVDTGGFDLVIEGSSPASIPLPPSSLQPGSLLLLDEVQLGQRPLDNDKLFLRNPGGAGVADARRVTNRLRGHSNQFPGRWVFPSSATPGTPNSFNFETDVVINEISYNPPMLPADPGIPPTVETLQLIGLNSTWRFNESGNDLGANWAGSAHPVGGDWESGPAIIGVDSGFPFPIATLVDPTQSNNPFVRTYYFERDFTLTGEQASDLESLDIQHLIDDGAVFYLNGVELFRFNMEDGPVTSSTLSDGGIGAATYVNAIVDVPPNTAVAGTNRFSVEVHQATTGSGDIIFDLSAEAVRILDPGLPPEPRRPSPEQWLELHNRSPNDINIENWDFGEGIDFTFPQNTILPGGGFIVVSNDPAALLVDHPGINVTGPFSGSLRRGGETLILRDGFGNPADIVRYDDGGRWPSSADGQGSSLELRDPQSDNSLPSAWAGSDELERTTWQTYSYVGRAAASTVGPDSQWREFVFGLLEEGEVLLDDISVIEDPTGAARQFLSDGDFQDGNLNEWRALGNHRHVAVVPDPENPGNRVLHLRATGSTEHMHNHLETTLAGGESVSNGRIYEISFKARWLSGANLFHTRLYFNRLPRTTELTRPSILGTPGTSNSRLEPNIGPTTWGMTHRPAVPAPGTPVTVSIEASDPDNVANLRLFYSTHSGPFQLVPMAPAGNGTTYEATIPGGTSGQTVQFYVEATDGQGAKSLTPAAGPESGAMYEVDDGRAANTGIHNFRIVMTPDDTTWMHTTRNVMSNDRLRCTVIYDERDIYYNCGVRIKGSERARSQQPRVGFNIAFPKDNLFRGVHRTLAIDRSEGVGTGVRELLFDLATTSSQGVPGEFNDLCYVISPDPAHTNAAILQLARFGSVFLDSQFENGAEGTVYEYELVYYPTTADGEGYKLPQPDGVVGTSITSMGANPENYRWNYLIKNNQEVDDFSGVINMVRQFDRSGASFDEGLEEVLDVDQWLRSLAYSCAIGAGDSYFANSRHNGQFYLRPDGRMLYFTHDVDFAFSTTRNIFQNSQLQELTLDQSRRRTYLGHLHDICTTTYNRDWIRDWTDHLDELIPGGDQLNDDLSYINSRSNYVLDQIENQVSPVTFRISTNGGAGFSTSVTPVTLEGRGWVNVREIRLAGSESPLPTTWTSTDDWSVSVPLSPGPNALSLEAVNFRGEVVGTDSITVTSTAASNLPATDTLVVSEIYYNPPGSDEATEYLELLNVSTDTPLDLTGVSTTGITFTFPAGVTLAPGGRLLLVSNQEAFEAKFGTGLPVAGTYSGNLSNQGEALALLLPDGSPVRSFAYDDSDPWPTAADGEGASLVLLAPQSAPDHSIAANWRASAVAGGSPGTTDIIDYASWKAGFGNPGDNDDPDNDGLRVIDEYFLGGSPLMPDLLRPTHDFSLGDTLIASIPRRAAAAFAEVDLQSSPDLEVWASAANVTLLSNNRIPGSDPAVDILTFQVTPLEAAPHFYRFVIGHGK